MTPFDPGTEAAEAQGRGLLQGVTVGVVTDNQDPEGLARVRVRMPWLEDGEVSHWARIAVLMAGKDMGTFFLPEIGDEVLLSAEHGDPSHLYVLGMLWNGKLTPPETNQDGNNNKRFIKTRSGHELMFIDDEAAPLAELKLKDGKKVSLSKDGVEITDGDAKIVIESGPKTITVESGHKLSIRSKTIAIEADASIEIKSSGTLTLKGSVVQIN